MTPSIKFIAPLLLVVLTGAPACGENETAEEASGCQAWSDKLLECYPELVTSLTVDVCQEEFEMFDSSCQSVATAYSFCLADLSCEDLMEYTEGALDDATTEFPCSVEEAVLKLCYPDE